MLFTPIFHVFQVTVIIEFIRVNRHEASRESFKLTKEMIDQCHVWVGIPEHTNAAQWIQIQRTIEYGAMQGVDVKIFKLMPKIRPLMKFNQHN